MAEAAPQPAGGERSAGRGRRARRDPARRAPRSQVTGRGAAQRLPGWRGGGAGVLPVPGSRSAAGAGAGYGRSRGPGLGCGSGAGRAGRRREAPPCGAGPAPPQPRRILRVREERPRLRPGPVPALSPAPRSAPRPRPPSCVTDTVLPRSRPLTRGTVLSPAPRQPWTVAGPPQPPRPPQVPPVRGRCHPRVNPLFLWD
ncbi:proline-rich protein 2-like [Pipra filicauda]|uniref:Proline-rich protein 2-like n=1 Tax=Pipra filicauda TaxID=649802 RepID=A0A7R5L2D4_9PASS|nr:proline-rich protein 2-like [Pipra filicauda]